jgi:hypothetical protein
MMHMNEIYITNGEVHALREPRLRVLRRSPLSFMTRDPEGLNTLNDFSLLPHDICRSDQLYRVP